MTQIDEQNHIVADNKKVLTEIDEPNLDKQIESDLLDMWLLWERGNWYLNDDHPNYDKEHDRRFRDAIVEYITKLIANQVREAYRKGYNDNARDCYCRSVEAPKSVLPHKHLLDDDKIHNIRPDLLKGDDK